MQNAAPIQTAMISAISNACKVKLNCSTKHGAEKNSNKNRQYPAWSFSFLPFQYQMANSAVKPARKNINSKRAFSINGIKRSIPNNFLVKINANRRCPYQDCSSSSGAVSINSLSTKYSPCTNRIPYSTNIRHAPNHRSTFVFL